MKNLRAALLHSEVMEPKALVMVASVDTVIVLQIGQTPMDLVVMVVTATLLHLQLQAVS